MDIKGKIKFIEGGFILKPDGGEQETWYKSLSVGESYITLGGFKYRPSNFKVKEQIEIEIDDVNEEED
jgi:hypothetical protein